MVVRVKVRLKALKGDKGKTIEGVAVLNAVMSQNILK
jgi:hypothetical protein